MQSRKLRVVLAAVAAGVLALTASPALGAKKVKSNVVFYGVTADIALGEVHSPSKKCKAHRKVTLHHVIPGSGSEKVGAIDTTTSGAWNLYGPFTAPGDYFASVSKRKKGKVVCGADRSPVKPLE